MRSIGFEQFDELMRIDLQSLLPIEVDYDKIPFGFDNKDDGIYRSQHGKRFYIGPQTWMLNSGTQWIFLTTEDLVSEVISVAYEKLRQPWLLHRCDLDRADGIYPLTLPVFLNPKAKKTALRDLVEEITAANPNALIIADSVKHKQVVNYMTMKGSNAFNEADVFIVLTALNPDVYALLNATGIFLDRCDVVALHYGDQLSQAAGRNSGFRTSDRETMTAVVVSNRLWKSVVRNIGLTGRVRLSEAKQSWS